MSFPSPGINTIELQIFLICVVWTLVSYLKPEHIKLYLNLGEKWVSTIEILQKMTGAKMRVRFACVVFVDKPRTHASRQQNFVPHAKQNGLNFAFGPRFSLSHDETTLGASDTFSTNQ
jgi:hypothetical protein